MSFEHSVGALERGRQEQQFLLNLGRQLSQFHDLAQAGPADMPDFGQLPVVANRAARYQGPELDRERYQATHVRCSSAELLLLFGLPHTATNRKRQQVLEAASVAQFY